MSSNKKVAKKYQESRGNGKGGKNYRNNKYRKDKNPKDVEQEEVKCTRDINDISYYVTDPATLAQTVNFSNRDFVGTPLKIGERTAGVTPLMRIEVTPCIPYTREDHANTDGFNMAMYHIFLEQIKDNKRPITYGPEDIGMPVLATGSILALAASIERMFGYMSCYNPRNRMWPRQVLKTLGVTESDVEHLADLRVKYNTQVVPMFNKLPMYAGFPYFNKCYNMFRNIYVDQDGSPMSQLYYLDPLCVWKYNDLYSEQGAGCETVYLLEEGDPHASTTTPMSLEHRIDLMIELTQALMSSTAMLTIQGDLMRYAEAHGKPLVSLPIIPDGLAFEPAHSQELDYWLDNACFVPYSITEATALDSGYTVANDVIPDLTTHACVYRPETRKLNNYGESDETLINFWHDSPSVEEKVYATRFATPEKLKKATTSIGERWITDDRACCDWTITNVRFMVPYGSYAWDESPFDSVAITSNNFLVNESSSGALTQAYIHIKQVDRLSQFDHHPRMTVAKQATSEAIDGIAGDLQYYTSVPFETLKSVHDVCALGLWRL